MLVSFSILQWPGDKRSSTGTYVEWSLPHRVVLLEVNMARFD